MREDDLFTVRVELRMTHGMTDLHVSGVLWTLRHIRARKVHALRYVRRHRRNRCVALPCSRKFDFDIILPYECVVVVKTQGDH